MKMKTLARLGYVSPQRIHSIVRATVGKVRVTKLYTVCMSGVIEHLLMDARVTQRNIRTILVHFQSHYRVPRNVYIEKVVTKYLSDEGAVEVDQTLNAITIFITYLINASMIIRDSCVKKSLGYKHLTAALQIISLQHNSQIYTELHTRGKDIVELFIHNVNVHKNNVTKIT